MSEAKLERLKPLLVCPDCRAPLAAAPAEFRCPACRAVFGVHSGVPDLLPPRRRQALEASLAAFRAPHAAVRGGRLFRALIPPDALFDPGQRARRTRVQAALKQGVVLNLGAKHTSWGEHVINVDVALPDAGGVDVLADLERLPFADNSIDGMVCSYVLEHVSDARACVDEIIRVLKPGGHLYVTVPFMFPTHPDPLDRWRWTLDGLRYSLRSCEELEAGACGGPCSTFVALAPTLAGSVFSNFFLFNTVRFTLGWLLWPLKYGDVFAARSRKAYMGASAFFFFGRKR